MIYGDGRHFRRCQANIMTAINNNFFGGGEMKKKKKIEKCLELPDLARKLKRTSFQTNLPPPHQKKNAKRKLATDSHSLSRQIPDRCMLYSGKMKKKRKIRTLSRFFQKIF
jgi:hypothetical protein